MIDMAQDDILSSDDLYVSFPARRLASPTIVWTNAAYLASVGIDPSSPDTMHKVHRWIIDCFAFVVPRPEDTEDVFSPETRMFYADRYGDTGIAPHGGSGRAGAAAGFQVKGIGATPLIGDDAGWLHSHGCLWMEEAIREAAFSSVYNQEFPHGAVPTIAIIDTGLHAQLVPGVIGERRALLVRPMVARLSHAQRATYFIRQPAYHEDQSADAARVTGVITSMEKCWEKHLSHLNRRVAAQIAFGHVFRLTHGGFLSSNICTDGRLIDFGAARSLPSWESFELSEQGLRTSNDVDLWIEALTSLNQQMDHYGSGSVHFDVEEFVANVREEYDRCILIFWGLPEAAGVDADVRRLLDLTRNEMQLRSDVQRTVHEIDSCATGSFVEQLEQRCATLLASIDEKWPRSKSATKRFATYRDLLSREGMQHYLFSHIVPRRPDDCVDTAVLRRFFTVIHTHGQHYFRDLDPFDVVAHFSDGISMVRAVSNPSSSSGIDGLVTGPYQENRIFFNGRWMDVVEDSSAQESSTSITVRATAQMDGAYMTFRYGRHVHRVGPMAVYSDEAGRG